MNTPQPPAADLRFHTIVSPLFAENAYVAHLIGDKRCFVVDPGLDMESLIEWIASNSLRPVAILNTHGHADHIAGNGEAKRRWPEAPIVIGHGDAFMLEDADANLSSMFGLGLTSPPADRLLAEGDCYEAAGVSMDILETPGQSPGHIVFICKQFSPWIVFGGDVLFRESVGRSDFPGGDPATLGHSIREKLFALPDDTIVLTGHGEPTTIGHEKKYNPYLDLLRS